MRQDRTTLRDVSCYSGISWSGPLPLLPLLYRRGTALRGRPTILALPAAQVQLVSVRISVTITSGINRPRQGHVTLRHSDQ